MSEIDWYRADEGKVTPTTRDSLPADDWTSGGTYSLVLTVPTETTLDVGSLGTHTFSSGAYVYTGSALGTGGYSRVDRHAAQCRGDRSVRHWHVDTLTTHSETSLASVVLAPGHDVECAVASVVCTDPPVDDFGASDCECHSHLGFYPATDAALESVSGRYETVTAG